MNDQGAAANFILNAYCFAEKAHAGQVRKYTSTPYFEHPLRVARRVIADPYCTWYMVCAALLHDVVEDCGVQPQEIGEQCGELTQKLVEDLTNPSKGSTLPRAERKQMDREHIAATSVRAQVIKAYDRIDNLREMGSAESGFIRLYCRESLALARVLDKISPELRYELNEAIILLLLKVYDET